MDISFEPMTERYAREIASWQYDPPYHVYGYSPSEKEESVAYLMAAENRVFALVRGGEVVAFRSFGRDGQVPGGTYDEGYLDTGGGLRPDLTGKGLGEEMLRRGLEFGFEQFESSRFRVTVAAFNQRALKVCRRVGFREGQRFRRQSDNEAFVILLLDEKGWKANRRRQRQGAAASRNG